MPIKRDKNIITKCRKETRSIRYSTGMLYAIVLYARPSVCLSLCFHDNSSTIRRRMMKRCTYILEVKSNMELEDGSRT